MVAFEQDPSIRVHERGVIAQLCSVFRSHENGLPEWLKNSSTAYVRNNTMSESRVLTLLIGRHPEAGKPYIALLDHVGMTVQDLETKFSNWGDPEAHLGDEDEDEFLEGGHGNGGKCYMTQMFAHHSYLSTVRNGRVSRYGFVGDDPTAGYFPDRECGRGVPISQPVVELRRELSNLGVSFDVLPDPVKEAAAVEPGFTLAVGVGAKDFKATQKATRSLVRSLLGHAQAEMTLQRSRVYVILNGQAVGEWCPIKLPDIPAHQYGREPRVVEIPETLEDPVSGESVATRLQSSMPGRLVLKTSKNSMRWSLKSRHNVVFKARGGPVGFLKMEDVSRSTWVDRIYGECRLDSLADYETPDRSFLADSPLTRAVIAWVKGQIFEYEAEFKKLEQLKSSQSERRELSKLNEVLDKWKNRFLEDVFGSGTGGEGTKRRSRRRPLPARAPVSVDIRCAYSKAGVGVLLRLGVTFRDIDGQKVAAPAYQWMSSDWAVATVDAGLGGLITHSPGSTEVWVETLDGQLRSSPLEVEVLATRFIRLEPEEVQVVAGRFAPLSATVIDQDGIEHNDVFLIWVQDDSSVLSVTATGKVIGRKPGMTNVVGMDERATSNYCSVTVTPAPFGAGSDGRGFPRILLSEIDPDPLNPDGETVHLSPEDGPVHQPTPQHVDNNIWWINLTCPLARYYAETYGHSSREWRAYHIERYVEALVKIQLAHLYQESPPSFDEMERRWREVGSDVQHRAIEELMPLIVGDELPGDE